MTDSSEVKAEPSSMSADRRRWAFFAIWGAVAAAVVLLFRAVLLPFFLAVVLAYVFEPVVSAMERWRVAGRGLPRWVAVVALYLGLLTTLGGLLAVGIPQLANEVKGLAVELPTRVNEVRKAFGHEFESEIRRWLGDSQPDVVDTPGDPSNQTPQRVTAPGTGVAAPGVGPAAHRGPTRPSSSIRVVPSRDGGYEVVLPPSGLEITEERDRLLIRPAPPEEGDDMDALDDLGRELSRAVRANAGSVVDVVKGAIRGVVRPVFTFFIMLMLSAYILITKVAILDFFRVLVREERRERFDSLLRRIDRGLSGVVRGQLLICVVNGVLSGIGFYALGLRYWWLLTLIATVLSIIPIFGAILSSFPAVVIGLQMSPMTALLTLLWILLIHQIEANLLNPKIMGDAAKVHPVLVVFALLSGEHLFGIAGALLAVPVLSITQSVFFHYRESALGITAPKADRTVG